MLKEAVSETIAQARNATIPVAAIVADNSNVITLDSITKWGAALLIAAQFAYLIWKWRKEYKQWRVLNPS